MACPYFFPTEKSSNIHWAFPQRLPLGAGFCGNCTAGGDSRPATEEELKSGCNLGYATGCSRLPADRPTDATRFSVAADNGNQIVLYYCSERAHAPVAHGKLQYDFAAGAWPAGHADTRIQRQAECFLASYLERRPRPTAINGK